MTGHTTPEEYALKHEASSNKVCMCAIKVTICSFPKSFLFQKHTHKGMTSNKCKLLQNVHHIVLLDMLYICCICNSEQYMLRLFIYV